MRECWINIYPHGIGYHCFAYKYQAEEASKGSDIRDVAMLFIAFM